MIDYRSKLLGYTNKPQQRVDEWTLINKQKSLQEQQAKLYQMRLAEQKRKQLKEDLDRQVREKNYKEQYNRKQDVYFADIMEKQAKEAKYMEERKRNQIKEKRREMEEKNTELFNGIVESKFRQSLMPSPNFIDIGVKNQIQRKIMTQNQKKQMIDELDRQIRVKQQQKYDSKRIQLEHDQANINYQMSKLSLMGVKHRNPGQSPYVYDYYQRIVEHEKQKEREYEKIHIKQAQKQKQMDDLQKVHEQNMNKKYLAHQMKNVLEQQVKIKAFQKEEQNRVNPEQLTYGTIGDMLNRRRPSQNKQQYFLDLKKQIQQKQKKQQQQRYMSEEQYKINLNHLNRAFEGNYANRGYLDRSIHALSDSHKIQQSAIDAHLDISPESEAARKKIEELKGRSRSRLTQSFHA